MLHPAPESLFWYWIAERHAIFLRRQSGKPKPWTTDPIFRGYKFTNPFRENDRGTVWLRENFLQPHKDDSPELLAFNICWYRMFNWWGTGEYLGWQTDWDAPRIIQKLNNKPGQVFTGAHIVYSTPGLPKIDAIADVCTHLWHVCNTSAFQSICAVQRSLEQAFYILKTVHCVGGFMAYEMVSDMRHTKLLENATDIMTWANPGPGARRGLQRLEMPYKSDTEAIESMRELLSRANLTNTDYSGSIAVDLRYEDYPVIEMRDIEHSLCEFDKYCRVKFGEGKPRSLYNGW